MIRRPDSKQPAVKIFFKALHESERKIPPLKTQAYTSDLSHAKIL
jgi:hypothetical protein